MRKKFLSFASVTLAFIMLSISITSCTLFERQEEHKDPVEIEIPDVVVDLKAPENKVDVPENEKSEVFDSNGNKLSSSEWLLNSKFAKSYIKKLGVGEYIFSYKSETKTGTIKLIITDNEAPDYVFTEAIPEKLTYLEIITLPYLVKNQDSYQDDCEVRYELKNGEKIVSFNESSNGLRTPALEAGEYTWTAYLSKNNQSYSFTQSFKVQSFEESIDETRNVTLFNEQKKEYVSFEDGVYKVDTQSNVGDHYYTVSYDVLAKAMTAGKKSITLTIVSDRVIDDSNGVLWVTNTWKGYAVGFNGADEFVNDKSAKTEPTRYITSLVIENGKYIYSATVFLDDTVFTKSQPLQLQFNGGAKCVADVIITFD